MQGNLLMAAGSSFRAMCRWSLGCLEEVRHPRGTGEGLAAAGGGRSSRSAARLRRLAAAGGSLEGGVDDGHDALRFSGAERVGALTWLGCFSTCGTRFPLELHIFEVLSRKYESEKQNHSIVKDFRCGHDMSGWRVGLLLVQDAFDTMQKDFLEREGQKPLGLLGGALGCQDW